MRTINPVLRCLAILVFIQLAASPATACFTIVVGKDASENGYVMMAHNEDDGPPQVVNHYKMPRKTYPAGEKYTLIGGGQIDQVPETWSYIWSEMPGLLFSDSFLNEWGVCVTSDNCPSREDKPELSDGGITWDLRRLVAQRAKTAREGVHLAAQWVERFGYQHSGRTYIISDPNEGWFFCVIHGKRWLAARVPDDQVAMVSNVYAVRAVNLADTMNYLACKDLVKYARSRGWYDPKRDGVFDFKVTFASPDAAYDSSNFCRQWGGLRFVMAETAPLSKDLPFSVIPREKLDAGDVMEILCDHYDWTEYYRTDMATGSPHQTYISTICNWTTQTSFVAELRADLPPEIGFTYWVSLGPPCTSAYIPFYFGMTDFPAGYALKEASAAISLFSERTEAPFQADVGHAYWTFWNFHQKIMQAYGTWGAPSKAMISDLSKQALELRISLEDAALAEQVTEPETAIRILDNFSRGLTFEAFESMSKILERH